MILNASRARTARIKVGTESWCCRCDNPVILAKRLATRDHIPPTAACSWRRGRLATSAEFDYMGVDFPPARQDHGSGLEIITGLDQEKSPATTSPTKLTRAPCLYPNRCRNQQRPIMIGGYVDADSPSAPQPRATDGHLLLHGGELRADLKKCARLRREPRAATHHELVSPQPVPICIGPATQHRGAQNRPARRSCPRTSLCRKVDHAAAQHEARSRSASSSCSAHRERHRPASFCALNPTKTSRWRLSPRKSSPGPQAKVAKRIDGGLFWQRPIARGAPVSGKYPSSFPPLDGVTNIGTRAPSPMSGRTLRNRRRLS